MLSSLRLLCIVPLVTVREGVFIVPVTSGTVSRSVCSSKHGKGVFSVTEHQSLSQDTTSHLLGWLQIEKGD